MKIFKHLYRQISFYYFTYKYIHLLFVIFILKMTFIYNTHYNIILHRTIFTSTYIKL